MKMNLVEKAQVNNYWSRKRIRTLTEKLLRYVEDEHKPEFLDVGCGDGEVINYIAKRYGSRVVGVDIDAGQLELARKKVDSLAYASVIEADATRLPFADGSFDVVVSFGVLQHIPNWEAALREITRVLRIGGYFLYADIIYPEAITRMDSSIKAGFGLITVDLDKLNSFIQDSGFDTLYTSTNKMFVCRSVEAVYRRKEEEFQKKQK
jgi:ubiquinone/menaquinone biosynthesis C-methylase UbiE